MSWDCESTIDAGTQCAIRNLVRWMREGVAADDVPLATGCAFSLQHTAHFRPREPLLRLAWSYAVELGPITNAADAAKVQRAATSSARFNTHHTDPNSWWAVRHDGTGRPSA